MRPAPLSSTFVLLLFTSSVTAANLTAKVDYGFGPLWISWDAGDSSDTNGNQTQTVGSSSMKDLASVPLSRCSNVTFEFGGGFGPYRMAAINAANASTSIDLSSNTTAEWMVQLAEDSHVAFNLTDRAGATLQTPFLKVKNSTEGSDGQPLTCGNDTNYVGEPQDDDSGSWSGKNVGKASWIMASVAVAGAVSVLV